MRFNNVAGLALGLAIPTGALSVPRNPAPEPAGKIVAQLFCDIVGGLVTVAKQQPQATSFCSSYLKIPVVTKTSTVTSFTAYVNTTSISTGMIFRSQQTGPLRQRPRSLRDRPRPPMQPTLLRQLILPLQRRLPRSLRRLQQPKPSILSHTLQLLHVHPQELYRSGALMSPRRSLHALTTTLKAKPSLQHANVLQCLPLARLPRQL